MSPAPETAPPAAARDVRVAEVHLHGEPAGTLEQDGSRWRFQYLSDYAGEPISLTLPVRAEPFEFDGVPPFFDGLLPEGVMLEGLLQSRKLDASDHFGQLVAIGSDLVGAVTIRARS